MYAICLNVNYSTCYKTLTRCSTTLKTAIRQTPNNLKTARIRCMVYEIIDRVIHVLKVNQNEFEKSKTEDDILDQQNGQKNNRNLFIFIVNVEWFFSFFFVIIYEYEIGQFSADFLIHFIHNIENVCLFY